MEFVLETGTSIYNLYIDGVKKDMYIKSTLSLEYYVPDNMKLLYHLYFNDMEVGRNPELNKLMDLGYMLYRDEELQKLTKENE